MEWNWALAEKFANALAAERNLTVVLPQNPIRKMVIAGARYVLNRNVLLGSGDAVLEIAAELLPDFSTTSVCLPLGVNDASLIIMSDASMRTPMGYSETLLHEADHDEQSDRKGHVRNAWDYGVSAEVRAQREAEAYSAGLMMRAVLTGGPIDAHEALVHLSSSSYHLDDDAQSLAAGIVLSHVDSLNRGVCPPIAVCKWALDWLRVNAHECIKLQLA